MRGAFRESGDGDGDGACAGPHVVMVPVPTQGHINPFNCLAHCLAASGVSVTLVHSAGTHSVPPSTSTLIHIEVLPDPHLPSDFKAALSTSTNIFHASLSAMRDGVEQLLEKLMQEKQAPCCLLIDSLLGWGHEVAIKFGLPRVDFWPGAASVFCMGYHLPELAARGYIPAIEQGSQEKTIDVIPGLSPFTIADLPQGLPVQEDLQSPAFQFFSSMFQHAKETDCMLVNTIDELESSALEAISTQLGVRIHPIGPLFMMSSAPSSPAASVFQEDNSCLSWLDQRQKCSVLYVAFGSIASIEEDAFTELAHGLEMSGESFLWVIRPDAFKGKASVEELLPGGFMERTHDRGLVISWAPQLAVLAHPSVGTFLTHCGWNSILESLSNGVPMLGFPQLAEQNTNLKFIVHDWKVGLPLLQPKDSHQHAGKVDRSHVERTVISIMRGDEGMQVRKRALEWREIAYKATNGTSKSNLQQFVDDLNLFLPYIN